MKKNFLLLSILVTVVAVITTSAIAYADDLNNHLIELENNDITNSIPEIKTCTIDGEDIILRGQEAQTIRKKQSVNLNVSIVSFNEPDSIKYYINYSDNTKSETYSIPIKDITVEEIIIEEDETESTTESEVDTETETDIENETDIDTESTAEDKETAETEETEPSKEEIKTYKKYLSTAVINIPDGTNGVVSLCAIDKKGLVSNEISTKTIFIESEKKANETNDISVIFKNNHESANSGKTLYNSKVFMSFAIQSVFSGINNAVWSIETEEGVNISNGTIFTQGENASSTKDLTYKIDKDIVSVLNSGVYRLIVKLTDNMGYNFSKIANFEVDNDSPQIRFGNLEDNSSYKGAFNSTVKITDNNISIGSIKYTLKGRTGNLIKEGMYNVEIFNSAENIVSLILRDTENERLPDDLYILTVYAEDKVGNNTSEAISFVLNRMGSIFYATDETVNISGKYINKPIDLVFNEVNIDNMNAYDRNVLLMHNGKPIKLSEGIDYRVDKVEESPKNNYRYRMFSDNFTDNGTYSLMIDTSDKAGNFNSLTEDMQMGLFSFGIDTEAPIISMNSDLDNKETDLLISVTDNIKVEDVRVCLDGEIVYKGKLTTAQKNNVHVSKKGIGIEIPEESKEHIVEIVAEDIAGNISNAEFAQSASVSVVEERTPEEYLENVADNSNATSGKEIVREGVFKIDLLFTLMLIVFVIITIPLTVYTIYRKIVKRRR